MNMAFKKFDRDYRVCKANYLKTPVASLNKDGLITLYNAALELKDVSRLPFVNFYFDESEKKLGIQPIKVKEENSNALFYNGRMNNAYVSAMAILNYYEIAFKDIKNRKVRLYSVEYDAENKMFVVDLNKEFVDEKEES
jgi:hypothetical protein